MSDLFEGEIRRNDAGVPRAVGFHHRNPAPGTARVRLVNGVEDITAGPDVNGLYRARVEIWDDVTSSWILKKGASTFFPDSWSRQQVLDEIRAAYANSTPLPNSSNGYIGTAPSGVEIRMFFGHQPSNSYMLDTAYGEMIQ